MILARPSEDASVRCAHSQQMAARGAAGYSHRARALLRCLAVGRSVFLLYVLRVGTERRFRPMSDHFEMLVDADVTIEQAEEVKLRVLDRFRELEIIAGEVNEECVLGGEGYRPGSAVSRLYTLGNQEYPFWDLLTCGVETNVARQFNYWAYGPSCEGYSCPCCEAEFEPHDEDLQETLAAAIDEWFEQSGPAVVTCPRCAKDVPITEWRCEPPLGFGNLSFSFWNWPRLDSPSWQIDIPALVREATGHAIISTNGQV